MPAIAWRAGIDRNPVDLTDPANIRWLLSCIWPGTDRHDRAAAAMDLASRLGPLVRQGDMIDDLPALIDDSPEGPVVVVTSWSASYLAEEERSRSRKVLEEAGRTRTVAWLCYDAPGTSDLFQVTAPFPVGRDLPSVLGLAVFGDGRTTFHSLAYVHAHGAWIHRLDDHMTPDI